MPPVYTMHHTEAHDNRNSGFVEADIRQCFNESGAHIVARASVTSKPSTGYSPCLLTRNYTKASIWVRNPTGSNLLVSEAGTADSQAPAYTPPSVNVLGSFFLCDEDFHILPIPAGQPQSVMQFISWARLTTVYHDFVSALQTALAMGDVAC